MESLMNFIMLTHEYPYPANYGGHVYTSKLIENMIDAGHSLSVISTHPETSELADQRYHSRFRFFSKIRGKQWRYATTRVPYMVMRYLSGEATQKLAQAVDDFGGQVDAIYVDYLGLGWMFPEIEGIFRDRGRPVPECIYVSHNVETDVRDLVARGYKGNPLIKRFLAYDAARTRKFELDMVKACGLVTTITEEDAKRFGEIGQVRQHYVLSPGYKGKTVAARTMDAGLPRSITLLGNRLTVMKKIVLDEFLEHNYNKLSDAGIGVEIAGPMKDDDLGRYRRDFGAFTYHGFVEDLDPLLGKVRIGLIADKVGGGFKHRFLTYVFSRVPIMAPRDSTAGLPLVEWEDYIPFDEPSEIAGLLQQHLDDLDMLNRIQNSAFQKCAEKFSYKANVRAFLDWYGNRRGISAQSGRETMTAS